MEHLATEFFERSDGMFAGHIGPNDGWLIKIKKPSVRIDGIQNPGSYYSRQGFCEKFCTI